jgi:hypothetical protein
VTGLVGDEQHPLEPALAAAQPVQSGEGGDQRLLVADGERGEAGDHGADVRHGAGRDLRGLGKHTAQQRCCNRTSGSIATSGRSLDNTASTVLAGNQNWRAKSTRCAIDVASGYSAGEPSSERSPVSPTAYSARSSGSTVPR